MIRRFGVLRRYTALLMLGYLLLFMLLHMPIHVHQLGILAIYPPGYLVASRSLNPFYQLNLLFENHRTALEIELLVLFILLFATYIRILTIIRKHIYAPVRLRDILIGVGLFSLPLLALPYLLSSDIFSYIMYGRIAVLHQHNPLFTPPSKYPHDIAFKYLLYWKDTTSAYGPVWLLISHGLTLAVESLGGAIWLYMLAYKLVALAAHIASAVLVWKILGQIKPEQQAWGTLLYAWNPLVLIEFVGSGHNDGTMLCLVLLALWLESRGRWRWAVVALVGAALVKVIAIVVLALYLVLLLRCQIDWPARLSLAGQVAVLVLLPVVLLYAPYSQGGNLLQTFTKTPAANMADNSLGQLAIKKGVDTLQELKLVGRSGRTWRQDLIEQAVGLLSKLISVGALLVALLMLWRQPTFTRLTRSCCWVLLAITLVTPWFWPWYVTWALALAALLDWGTEVRIALLFSALTPIVYSGSAFSTRSLFVFLPVLGLLAYQIARQQRIWKLRRELGEQPAHNTVS